MPEHTSPFQNIHTDLNADMKQYHTWNLPADYGDSQLESQKLRENCCAFDLSSFGRIEIKGSNAEKLISEITATNISNLQPGQVQWSIICSDKGTIVDFIRIAAKKDSFTVITTPPKREMVYKLITETAKADHLKDIEIDDNTETTAMIGIYGPKAFDIAKKLLPITLDDLLVNSSKEINVFMINAQILRSAAIGTDGIEIITSSKAAMFAGMAIEKYEKEGLIQAGGMDCLNRAMLESSLPVSMECRAEFEKYNPFSLGITDKLDMSKKFIGKDFIAENSENLSKKIVVGLKVPGIKKRHYNMNVQFDDGRIGWLDILDFSNTLDSGIGIAIIDAEYADLTDELQIEGDGVIMGAEIVKFPIIKDLANSLYM